MVITWTSEPFEPKLFLWGFGRSPGHHVHRHPLARKHGAWSQCINHSNSASFLRPVVLGMEGQDLLGVSASLLGQLAGADQGVHLGSWHLAQE